MAPKGHVVGQAFVQVAPSFEGAQKAIADHFRNVKIPVHFDEKNIGKDASSAIGEAVSKAAGKTTFTPKVDRRSFIKEINDAVKQAGQPQVTLKPAVDKAFAKTVSKLVGDIDAKISLLVDESESDRKLREYLTRKRAAVVELDVRDTRLRRRIAELEQEQIDLNAEVHLEIAKEQQTIFDLLDARGKAERQKKAKLHFDADISAAQQRIQALESTGTRIRADLELNKADFESQLATVASKRAGIKLDVDTAEINSAQSDLQRLENAASRLDGKDVQLNIEAQDAGRVIFLLGAILSGLAAVGAAAPAVVGALAAIPAALAGATQTVGALVATFDGVGDAVKAMQAVEDEAASRSSANSQARINQANQVANAQRSLQRALEQVDRVAITGAEQVASAREALSTAIERAHRVEIDSARDVAEAREAVAEAYEQAAEDIADAERQLTEAQREQRQAQDDLNQARIEAKERIEDLRLALKSAALDEEAAILRLEKARERLATALEGEGDSPEFLASREYKELDLAVRQAAQSLDEARDKHGDLAAESRKAAQEGVKGDARVQAAHQRLATATQRTAEAERNLTEARADAAERVSDAQRALADSQATAARNQRDAAKDVTRAHREVAKAQRTAAWAQADAAAAVVDAQRQVAQAATKAGGEGSAAMDKMRLAMAKLTPEGRSFAMFWQNEFKPAVRGIRDAVQAASAPKFEQAFRNLLQIAPNVTDVLVETGKVLGDIAIMFSERMTTPEWLSDFDAIAERNNRILGTIGDTAFEVTDAFRSISVTVGPFLEHISDKIYLAANAFNEWIQGARESGELARWFGEAQQVFDDLWDIVKRIAPAVWDFVRALAPLGEFFLQAVTVLAEFVGYLSETAPLLVQIIAVLTIAGSGFVTLARGIGGVGTAIRQANDVFRYSRGVMSDATKGVGKLGTAYTLVRHPINSATGSVDKFRTSIATSTAAMAATRTGATTFGAAASSIAANGSIAALAIRKVGEASALTRSGIVGFTPATAALDKAFQQLSGRISTVATADVAKVSRASAIMTTGLGKVRSAASTTGKALASGIGKATSGLVGALGGPWGLAITGAITGLGLLLSSQSSASKAAEGHKEALAGLTDELVRSKGAMTGSALELISQNLEKSSILDNADNLGLSLERMTDALAAGGQPAKQFGQEIANLAFSSEAFAGLSESTRQHIAALATQLTQTGGVAEDFLLHIDAITNAYASQTSASDAQTATFHKHLTELFDLAGGYKFATTEVEKNKAAADRQIDANGRNATSTRVLTGTIEEQARALQGLIDKQRTQARLALSLSEAERGYEEALDAANRSIAENGRTLDIHTAQGRANKTALEAISTRTFDLVDAMAASGAENHELRAAMVQGREEFIRFAQKMGLTEEAARRYANRLRLIPSKVSTKLTLDTTGAQGAIEGFLKDNRGRTLAIQLKAGTTQFFATRTKSGALRLGGRAMAEGGILGLAGGANLSARNATVVPPNTMRLIGDRMRGDEAFIPIDGSSRSQQILSQTASRMGYALMPMLAGGILRMANGGVARKAKRRTTAAGATNGLALAPEELGAVSSALNSVDNALGDTTKHFAALNNSGLARTSSEIGKRTLPALKQLQTHAGVRSVRSIKQLGATLPPLRANMTKTSSTVRSDWTSMTNKASSSVTRTRSDLSSLRSGLGLARESFGNTATSVNSTWSKIRGYAAAPVRSVLRGPINEGLVRAWNKLSSFFDLGKKLSSMRVEFASGGTVPGFGNADTQPIWATPGEIVIRKAIAERYKNFLLAFNAGQPEALQAAGGPRARGPHYARGGVVADTGSQYSAAIARAVKAARKLDGKRYVWGGASLSGVDCSGFMSVLTRALLNQRNIWQRMWTTASFGTGRGHGFTPGLTSAFAIGNTPSSHQAGTLAGVNVESGGSHNTSRYGGPAVGADHSQFRYRASLPVVGGRFVGGGDGAFDPTPAVEAALAGTYKRIAEYQKRWGGNRMGMAGAGMATQGTDAAKAFALKQVMSFGGIASGAAGSPEVRRAVRAVANSYGWGTGAQWAALSALIAKESSWNPSAANPTSSARGLFQKMTSIHGPLEGTVAGQARWGLNYIKGRYGDPVSAWAWHRGHNWYDDGGWLPPGFSTVHNSTGKPEPVLTNDQWRAITSLAGIGQQAGPSRSVTVNARTDASPQHIAHTVDRHLAIGSRL